MSRMSIPRCNKMNLAQAFPHLSSEELIAEIEKNAKKLHFKRGDIIIDVGDSIQFMPLLTKGIIKIVREDDEEHELLMYYLQPGDTCAVSLTCCNVGQTSEIRAIAEDDVELLAVPVDFIDRWSLEYKGWKNFIMETYRKRFEELLNTIDEIAFKKMDERLKNYLRKKALANEKNIINVTHSEIATDLNSSREVVSRLLKQLEKKGEIKLGRNSIDVSELH